jgi:hypothetical protein|tara:strand:- start:3666 stop:3833 length:168 start_codon:yes stop_codon:yes gene_type:complete
VDNFNGKVVRQEVITYYIAADDIMTKHVKTTDHCGDGSVIEGVSTIPIADRGKFK